MSITAFPTAKRDQVSFDQACAWLSRIDRDLTNDERAELEAWLSENPDHLTLLIGIAEEWDKFDAVSLLVSGMPGSSARFTGRQSYRKISFAIAASLFIVLVSALLFQSQVPRDGAADLSAQQQNFVTEIGEKSNVMLSDGSELTINTNTRLSFELSAEERKLVLHSGEIFVHVKPNRNLPFNVYVGDQVVQAVGTAFNVEFVQQGDVEIIVTDGSVIVRSETPNHKNLAPRTKSKAVAREALVPVKAGEIFQTLADVPMHRQLTPAEASTKLAWQSGNLVFHGETLAQAIREIERYSRVEFVLTDSRLNDITVAGVFRAGDIDGLLKTLEDNFDVSYQRLNSDQVLLAPR